MKTLHRKNTPSVLKQFDKKKVKITEKDSGPYGSYTTLANKVVIEKENRPAGYYPEIVVDVKDRKGYTRRIEATDTKSFKEIKNKYDKDTLTVRRQLNRKYKPHKLNR